MTDSSQTESDDSIFLPTKVVAKAPVISAEAYSHVGRYAGAVVMAAFEQIGGVNRLSDWADTNPSDFFTKVFPKMISKTQQIDVSGSVSIDDAIGRLERIEEADFTEVEEKEWDL